MKKMPESDRDAIRRKGIKLFSGALNAFNKNVKEGKVNISSTQAISMHKYLRDLASIEKQVREELPELNKDLDELIDPW
jgi:hypothetical protein